MSKRTSSSIRRPAATRRGASATLGSERTASERGASNGSNGSDRRTRLRLRELCDEVIASFRVARGSDLLSEHERAEANQLLARLTPAVARASA